MVRRHGIPDAYETPDHPHYLKVGNLPALSDKNTENAVGRSEYSWLVGTQKNLTVSDLFYLSIFQEGESSSDSNSHYFNIRPEDAERRTSSLPSTTVPTSTSATSSTSTTAPAPASSPPSSGTEARNQPDGFPTGVKVGLGVGIPIALILCFVAGFLCFRHRRKTQEQAGKNPYMAAPPLPQNQEDYQSMGGYYAGSQYNKWQQSPVEAPDRAQSPVELDHGHAGDPSKLEHRRGEAL
jgi:hypothetical protein